MSTEGEGAICPIIKGQCVACYHYNNKTYCDVSASEIHKGEQCPDDVEPDDQLFE